MGRDASSARFSAAPSLLRGKEGGRHRGGSQKGHGRDASQPRTIYKCAADASSMGSFASRPDASTLILGT